MLCLVLRNSVLLILSGLSCFRTLAVMRVSDFVIVVVLFVFWLTSIYLLLFSADEVSQLMLSGVKKKSICLSFALYAVSA